jgi:hypothetical protein
MVAKRTWQVPMDELGKSPVGQSEGRRQNEALINSF